ncbi:MAG: TRAP transporter large permease [Candidatus Thermoplasmatota archaeon]|nr:TRAP transporter large permease [Candidatus Thermoplasmatota archaeon]
MTISIILFLLGAYLYFPDLHLNILIQQTLSGISPAALVCIPMFILTASIITSGDVAKKMLNMVKVFLGHIHGALPIITSIGCTIFGSVSGSTQSTVAAIGGTMRPMMLEAGYPSSFTLGLIINASDIAWLIPPSIGFIVYGVATKTSIGKLFLSGILPGILVCVLFSIFSYIYSKYKNIPTYPKSTLKDRIQAVKEGYPIIGFPILILGGIYSGIFSPTEAAAISVLYALLLEGVIYRSLTLKKFIDATISTGVITAVVYILIGTTTAATWLVSYSGISKQILPPLFGDNPSTLRVVLIIQVAYFIACMFVDGIIAIYVLTPLFVPYLIQSNIDPILMGVLVVTQVAIGTATPPFGGDIFTAMVIFRRPYFETIRMTWVFVVILEIALIIIYNFPQLALFIPNMAFGK